MLFGECLKDVFQRCELWKEIITLTPPFSFLFSNYILQIKRAIGHCVSCHHRIPNYAHPHHLEHNYNDI